MEDISTCDNSTSDILKRLDENLQCCVCMEQYTDPRILNCIHTFCYECISSHVGDSSIIRCPLCNDQSPVPLSGLSRLRCNFFMKTLIDSISNIKLSLSAAVDKASKVNVCSSCDEEQRILAAYCNECSGKICPQCQQIHTTVKALRQHNVRAVVKSNVKDQDDGREFLALIEDFQNSLACSISGTESHARSTSVDIKKVRDEAEQTILKLDKNYNILLENIEEYVNEIKIRIKNNTTERLGSLPKQLETYEKQLCSLNLLQSQCDSVKQLESTNASKLSLVNELKNVFDHFTEDVSRMSAVLDTEDTNIYKVQQVHFMGSNGDLDVKLLLREIVGFLLPVKERHERNVEILEEVCVTKKMTDYAVLCAQDALDIYNCYTRNSLSLNNIKVHILKTFSKQYRADKWNCIVGIGLFSMSKFSKSLLTFKIDGLIVCLLRGS